MTEFDPVRAQREIVAGFADVIRVISGLLADAERRLAEAEVAHNNFLKLERWARAQCDAERVKLHALDTEAAAKS